VTLLHCTTEYPAAVADTNLRAMATLRRAFGLPVGYSDHTDGDAVTLAAVALGAVAIEKHMTLDRTLPGPDHKASIEPDAFGRMVRGIRAVEAAMGDGIKRPSGPEAANRAVARKSLFAARDLPAGHVLEERDVVVMRPGTGRAPSEIWDLLGKPLSAALRGGDPL
jgi:N-acetylneuraminate synthase